MNRMFCSYPSHMDEWVPSWNKVSSFFGEFIEFFENYYFKVSLVYFAVVDYAEEYSIFIHSWSSISHNTVKQKSLKW